MRGVFGVQASKGTRCQNLLQGMERCAVDLPHTVKCGRNGEKKSLFTVMLLMLYRVKKFLACACIAHLHQGLHQASRLADICAVAAVAFQGWRPSSLL